MLTRMEDGVWSRPSPLGFSGPFSDVDHFMTRDGERMSSARLGTWELAVGDSLLLEADPAFIERHRDRPFALFLAHHAPHVPLQAPADLIEKYGTAVCHFHLALF